MCGALGSQVLFRSPDRLHATPGEYTYKRCAACHTVFQDPRIIPEDLAICYPGQYYTHAAPALKTEPQSLDAQAPHMQRSLWQFRDALRRAVVNAVQGNMQTGPLARAGKLFASSHRLRERAFYNHVTDELIPRAPDCLLALDIGCGSGRVMEALGRVGWQVEGVEWDPAAAKVAMQATGRKVSIGDFRSIHLRPASYDLIVLSHVFEHLDAPLPALRRIKELLAPAGRAVLFYPNPESLGARLFRGNWYPWEAPRHLVLPPAQALAEAAKSIGLTPTQWRTHGKDAAAYFAHSRAYRAGRAVVESTPDINGWDKLVAAVEKLLNRVTSNLGEEVVLVLKKNQD
jgi:SAM-dependent methyltransferase